MAKSVNLQTIDQKIKDLQDKKRSLEQKQISELAKLLKRVEAHALPTELLTGALIEVVEVFKGEQEKTKQWIQKGEAFLKISKSKKGEDQTEKEKQKEDKKTSSSFLGGEGSSASSS